jgi:hypothetical protein
MTWKASSSLRSYKGTPMSQNDNPGGITNANITEAFEIGLDRVCELVTVQIENVKQGIDGVNDRLDTVNGRLYKHEGRISAIEGREEIRLPVPATRSAKIAAGTAGGVGILAVLHSLFEMVRSVGPTLFEMMFRHIK